MYEITTLIAITLWSEMNVNIFKSCLMIFMTVLFTGLQVKRREQGSRESQFLLPKTFPKYEQLMKN
jgi:hypothetical protein